MSEAQRMVGAMISTFTYFVAMKAAADMARGYCVWPPETTEVEEIIGQLQPEEGSQL